MLEAGVMSENQRPRGTGMVDTLDDWKNHRVRAIGSLNQLATHAVQRCKWDDGHDG